MPIARFQMPDGRIARFEVPEGTSPEQAQSLMEAHFSQSAAPAVAPQEISPSEGMPSNKRFDYASSTLEERRAARKAGIQGSKDVGAGIVTAVPEIGTNILGIIPGGERVQQSVSNLIAGVPSNVPFEPGAGRQAIRSLAQDVTGGDPNSPMASIARTGTQIGLTLGAPGAVARTMQFGAKLAPSAAGFLTPAAAAIESGGFGAKLAENRLADLALRGLAGGVSGAASMAPIDSESMGAGVGFGALLPTVLRPIAGAYKAVVPFVKDLFNPELKAANIARQAAGPNLPEIQAAARVASPTETAGQAVAGVDRAQMQALAEAIAQRDASNALRQKVGQQTAVEENTLARLAGGQTQAEVVGRTKDMSSALREQTVPMLEQSLTRANQITDELLRLERAAPQLSKEAAAEVANVRRLVDAGNIAQASARLGLIQKNLPVGFTKYTYPGELSAKADQWANQAAARSLELGQEAGQAAGTAQTMRSAGIEPLTADALKNKIKSVMTVEQTGNDTLKSAVNNVLKDIDAAAAATGAVDARAVYAIRKNSVNEFIKKMFPGAMDSAQKAEAARIMGQINPIIDQAIEKAGGKGFQDYLKSYAEGQRGIERTEMAAKLRDLYKTDKKAFVDIVNGNNVDAVRDVFGPTKFDINKEMGESMMKDMRQIASNIERTEAMKKLAGAGEVNLQEIIKANTSGFRIPSFIPKSTVPNAVLAEMQSRLSTKVLDQLERGFQSGASLNELLSKVPTQHRDFVARAIMRSMESMGGARGIPANMLAPSSQNALSQNQ